MVTTSWSRSGMVTGSVHRGRGHLSGEDTEAFFPSPDLGPTLICPAHKDEETPELAAPAD
jgi:hypothetical protein